MRGSNAERWKLTSLSSPIFEVKYFSMLFTAASPVFMAVATADIMAEETVQERGRKTEADVKV